MSKINNETSLSGIDQDVDPEALAWLADYDPGDGKGGAIGPTDGSEEFTRDVVLAAFVAGRDDSIVAGLALSLVQDLGELIDNSRGVYGLHLNGDPAPWEELTAGGRFEAWLSSFDRIKAELDKRESRAAKTASVGLDPEVIDAMRQSYEGDEN